jgi:hypothetical protein
MPVTVDLHAKEYSAKSFVVRGNTKIYKEKLKEIGGKYNSRLKDDESEDGISPGWIFPKNKLPQFNNFLNTFQQSVETFPPDEITCSGCKELNKKMDELNRKMQKILDFHEENEKMRKQMMSGTSNMCSNIMKNFFGGPMNISPENDNQIPLSSIEDNINTMDFRDKLNFPPNQNYHKMVPPSVSIIEEIIEEDEPSAILFN